MAPLWSQIVLGVTSALFSFWIGVRHGRNLERNRKKKA